MKNLLTLLLIVPLVAARRYSSKHDSIDIDSLVKFPQYMETSAGCYLDRNPCNRVTAALKRAIPEIVQSACAKCTRTQKYILRRYLEELKIQLPQDYAAFKHKYDPNSIYFDNLLAAIQ